MSQKQSKNRNGDPDIGMSVAIGIIFVTVMGLLVIYSISSGQIYDAQKEARQIAASEWRLVVSQISEDANGIRVTFVMVGDSTQRWSRIIHKHHEAFSDFASILEGEVVEFKFMRQLYPKPHDAVSYLRPR